MTVTRLLEPLGEGASGAPGSGALPSPSTRYVDTGGDQNLGKTSRKRQVPGARLPSTHTAFNDGCFSRAQPRRPRSPDLLGLVRQALVRENVLPARKPPEATGLAPFFILARLWNIFKNV